MLDFSKIKLEQLIDERAVVRTWLETHEKGLAVYSVDVYFAKEDGNAINPPDMLTVAIKRRIKATIGDIIKEAHRVIEMESSRVIVERRDEFIKKLFTE